MSKVAMMKNELARLGTNIRTVRRGLKISQGKLALRCDVQRTYLSDVERGRRNLSICSLLAIARGLGIAVADLTRNLGSDNSSPKSLARDQVARP
jgi:transcriptional regulator with XRE-family HTH domain